MLWQSWRLRVGGTIFPKKHWQLEPNLTEAQINLGAALQELGRSEEAEAAYRKAIVQRPDFAETHYNLGNTLKELGKLDDSEASLRKA